MNTRSKLNLKNKSIHSLLLPEEYQTQPQIKKRTLKRSPKHGKSSGKKKAVAKKTVKKISIKPNIDNLSFIILDTESFSLKKNEDDELKTLPIQISWQKYKGRDLNTQSEKRMFYIAEMWLISEYRDQINEAKYFTKNTKQKHENHMKNQDFPILSAQKILELLEEDLKECDYFCAFNLEWDRKSIENMIDVLELKSNNKNIFENVNCLDIMYFTYEIFSTQLISKGIEDKIINTAGKLINYRSKGIYSAEYMLTVLSKGELEQVHLADKDVDCERFLLSESLKAGNLNLLKKIDTSVPLYEIVQSKVNDMYKHSLYMLIKIRNNDLCYKCNKLIHKNDYAYRHKYLTDRFVCEKCDHSTTTN